MTVSRLTALHMSYTVIAATAQAVRHSISTPVRSVLTAVAVMRTSRRATSNRASTVTASRRTWWHSGISCHVSLAAQTPASRDTARTSPFLHASSAISLVAVSFSRTWATAAAVRRVSRFPDTSTMWACPDRPSTCVKRGASVRVAAERVFADRPRRLRLSSAAPTRDTFARSGRRLTSVTRSIKLFLTRGDFQPDPLRQ